MRKIIISAAVICITVVTIMLFGIVDASAEIFSGNCGTANSNVTWTLDTVTGILSIKGSGSTKDYSKAAISGSTAPPWRKYADFIKTVSIDGLDGIGKYSFAGCENLTAVSFSEKVAVIREGTFYGCSALKSFEFSAAVTEIGNNAFYNCRAIETLNIPAGLAKIGEDAFYGCSGIKSITVESGNIAFRSEENCLIDIEKSSIVRGSVSGKIPTSVKCIGDGAFSGLANLKEITVPDAVEYIGYGAFSDCVNVEKISLPFIGDCRVGSDGKPSYVPEKDKDAERGKLKNCLWYVFGDLKTPKSLKHVTVTDTLVIGLEAFANTENLESVTLCDSIVRIDSGAFLGCSSLAEIKIPQNVTVIGNSAFYGCSRLNSITVPDKVMTVGDLAFANCLSLESVSLGAYISSLGSGAFSGCKKLSNINISPLNVKYYSGVGCIVERESKTLVVGCNSTVIPEDIVNIGDGAFKNCDGITTVTLPTSVKIIGKSAFEGCSNMTDIVLPEGLQEIGDLAFADCVNLKSVKLPASVTRVGDAAFKNCTSFKSDGNVKPLDNKSSCASCNGCSGLSFAFGMLAVMICAIASVTIIKRK